MASEMMKEQGDCEIPARNRPVLQQHVAGGGEEELKIPVCTPSERRRSAVEEFGTGAVVGQALYANFSQYG
jgi:hypothetical protein